MCEAASADRLRRGLNSPRANSNKGAILMKKVLISFLLVCATFPTFTCMAKVSSLTEGDGNSPTSALNPVIQWNRTLLVIVRTPGAQPATMHSTRSFAIMHAAIYDAVNAIDQRHKPYLVTLPDV